MSIAAKSNGEETVQFFCHCNWIEGSGEEHRLEIDDNLEGRVLIVASLSNSSPACAADQ